MKNSNLFLLVAALFAFVSCGTANLTAQWGASQYRNGIYYSAAVPSDVQSAPVPAQTQEYVELEPQAAVALSYGESYEERLRKFDSPVYVVNVDYVDLYPWWTLNFAWNSHSWGWYHSWYARPYWSSAYWYPGSYWDWYWADSWWYNRHWYAHHHYPHYRPIHTPPHHRPHQPARNVYYGKRDYVPSYRDVNRGYVSTGSKSPMGNPSGSVTRRPGDVKGNATAVKGQQEQSQYRRTTGQSGNTNVKRGQPENTKTTQSSSQNSSSQNEYRRSSSSSSQQYNRSGSTSPGRSGYGYSGGGGSRSGSSSSSGSYRRR